MGLLPPAFLLPLLLCLGCLNTEGLHHHALKVHGGGKMLPRGAAVRGMEHSAMPVCHDWGGRAEGGVGRRLRGREEGGRVERRGGAGACVLRMAGACT